MKCTMCKHKKPNECFEKPGGGFYKTCDTCREYGREYSQWYSKTYPERRTASRKRFKQSPKGKVTEKKYRQGEKGRATQKRIKTKYRASEKGKATERAYGRRRNQAYRQKYAEQICARSAISNALRDERLVRPHHCQICGRVAKLHAHHYHGWQKEHHYDVWWLCKHCDPPTNSPLPHDGSLTLQEAKELINPPTLED